MKQKTGRRGVKTEPEGFMLGWFVEQWGVFGGQNLKR